MGWIWDNDDGKAPDSSLFSSLQCDDWRRSSSSEEKEKCSTRKVVKSNCRTEEVEPGKFVRKCDTTEQILRECVGRPAEVVESNSEHTEEDVTDEVTSGRVSLGSLEMDPFSFPGLRSDIEALEQSMLGGLGNFFQAAEEMKNDFFQSFGKTPSYRESPPFTRQVPFEDGRDKDAPKRGNGPAYEEFAGQVKDV